MKVKFLLILILILVTAQCSFNNQEVIRGSGKVVKDVRKIEGVNGVKVTTFVDVVISLGEKENLVLEAEENLQEYILTEVEHGILIIKIKPYVRIRSRKGATAYLTVKNLDTIYTTSSGDVTAPDLQAKHFYVRSTSSGDIKVGDLSTEKSEFFLSSSGGVKTGKIKGDKLKAQISSSGSLRILGGTVEEEYIRLTSSGSFKAADLKCKSADVSITSSGSVIIRVSQTLETSLTSSGSIYYYGNPEVSVRRTSSGRVKKMGD